MVRRSAIVWWAAAALAGGISCEAAETIEWGDKVTSLQVTVRDLDGQGLGTAEAPRMLPDPGAVGAGIKLSVDVVALSGLPGGGVVPYNGWVRLSSRPGRIWIKMGPGVVGDDVLLTDGERRNVEITVEGAFGVTHVWAEDRGIEDDGFSGGAGGVSQPLYVQRPTLGQVQGFATSSPYAGDPFCDAEDPDCQRSETVTVHVDGAKPLVVTRVTNDGMYVTDLSDAANQGYNHLFVFNFNAPTIVPICTEDEADLGNCQVMEPMRVQVCDKVKALAGIVSEFYGYTELTFPSFEVDQWDPKGAAPCGIPEPRELTSMDISTLRVMESMEAGLVRLRNVTVSDPPVSCDIDGDGRVNYLVPAEDKCQTDCDKNPKCTEAVNYAEFKQWGAGVSGVRILVLTADADPKFDPFTHPGTISSITGTLRHWKGGPRNMWTVEPRCKDDIVLTGDPKPAHEACVYPRIDSSIGSGGPM